MAQKAVSSGHFAFKVDKEGKLDKSCLVCTHCKKEYVYHRSSHSMSYHLMAEHPFAVESFKAGKPMNETKDKPLPKQSILSFGSVTSKQKKDAMTAALAEWIALNARPILLCEDEGFLNFCRVATSDPSYNTPSRKTISSRIRVLYEGKREGVMGMIAGSSSICITCDYWSSVAMHSYLGVTAHFVDKGFNLKSCVLAVAHSQDRHAATLVAEHLTAICEEWKLLNKVTAIVTDNAANMVNAITREMKQEHIRCLAHSIQLAVRKAIDASKLDSPLAKVKKIVGHFKHSPANMMELHASQKEADLPQESLVSRLGIYRIVMNFIC